MRVLITTWLEPELVARLRKVDPRLEVVYEETLVPAPRYAADHTGHPLTRSIADEARWRALLASADVMFDFDRTSLDALPELAPRVRWIQGSSAGIGGLVADHDLARRMPDTVFTTAVGVHAQPLAEYAILCILWFAKQAARIVEDQRARRWVRFSSTDLAGRQALIVGLGAIGTELARLCRSFRMRTVGVKRTVDGVDPESLHVDSLHPPGELRALLPSADYVVLIAPHTQDSERMIGAPELALMRPDAVLVNIGRGALVDEAALADALEAGVIAGAALDVFETEPLPESSPLWALPNVLLSPHSSATSDRENGRIVELFAENLRRYLAGEPLLNLYGRERGY